ncbi:putative sigma-54 modulation protein [Bacillus mesophilus]|uniref:Ribosome hibernation promoting factor n=1 Tax=Bacillus mesophilus TaxID=1808955 RepID=A0A6M0QB55_9BACI|nr:ribosome-associated translation inhibitor RaiA [Bacillus mesophilus]MBM7661579.1 putative sigma-54 modulation protein [Bacillus mesophilus]NEY72248.1 ribosome-associated translation inhibitor RaiA [Bacillus mesophilus]
MKFNIRGENIEVTPALREFVEQKVGKLDRYFEDGLNANVNVNLKVYNNKQKVEVTVPMTQLTLRAEEQHDDLYAAIDLVLDKLERQIRKHKTRVNKKLRDQGSPKFMFTNGVEPKGTYLDEVDEDEVVRTKRFNLKPMDSEEAILQMNMLGHSFFVYTSSSTNNTNVVYKRKDGKYGIIEPS